MTRDDDLRRVEAEVGVLIRRVRRALAERAKAVHPDLHPASLVMLSHVLTEGPTRAVDLAELFHMDKAGVSRQVTMLVDLGLLERHADPADRRAQLLAITPLARERLEAVRAERSARFDRLLAEWSDEELSGFAEGLSRYNAALDPRD